MENIKRAGCNKRVGCIKIKSLNKRVKKCLDQFLDFFLNSFLSILYLEREIKWAFLKIGQSDENSEI